MSKYVYFIIFYLSFCISSSYAMDTEWHCLEEGPPSYLPHAQDPFKERISLQDCEEKLKQKFFSQNKESTHLFDIENKQVINLGHFIIDERLFLGYGDTAEVCLALHLSSNVLFAAKRIVYESVKKLKEYGDYISLKKLDRLYGLYEKTLDSKRNLYYLLMPFGGLNDINSARTFLASKTIKENIETRLRLVDGLLNELSFLASRGVWHLDQNSAHYFPGWNYKYVLGIDFNSIYFSAEKQTQTNIPEEQYGVTNVHQGIIHRLILGDKYGDKEWKKYIEDISNNSEEVKKLLGDFGGYFKNVYETEKYPLPDAKCVWEKFKNNFNEIVKENL